MLGTAHDLRRLCTTLHDEEETKTRSTVEFVVLHEKHQLVPNIEFAIVIGVR